jgi:nitrite reductase/ring-hydroxylating ferredoxin subunit
MAFQKVATLDELWSGEMMALESAGQPILLVNLDGRIQAYADPCPHLRTRLSQGVFATQRPGLRDPWMAVQCEYRTGHQPPIRLSRIFRR